MAAFPNTTTAPEILRPIIESEIERLISILDAIDPDPDLEDPADGEPWLGWSLGGDSFGPGDDRELDMVDDEPSLGAIEVKLPVPIYRMGGGHGHCLFPALYREHGEHTRSEAGFSQERWNSGPHDLEEEHEGREPGEDDEWSLGWTELEARFGKHGSGGDYEEQCEDEGAQCDDEGDISDARDMDYRDLRIDYGYPGPLFGEGVGYNPNRNPENVRTRDLWSGDVLPAATPLFGGSHHG